MIACLLALPLMFDAPSLEAKLDAVVPQRLAETRVPGLVVSVVADGEVVLAKGYGLADLESKRPMTADTPVRIASLSKTFTATAVAMLEAEGLLDVDAPVDDYLGPDRLPPVFDKPITLRHLLSHTSGVINNNVGRVELQPPEEPLGEFLRATMPTRAYPPGRVVLYSNHGNALAGHAVAQVSGQEFTEFVKGRILDPLEMHRTGYEPVPDLATSYVIEDDVVREQVYLHFKTVPASGVVTTANDITRYLLLHTGDGTVDGARVVPSEALARMRASEPAIHPALPTYHYAFAHVPVVGHPARTHGGSVPAFLSKLVVLDDARVGVFVAQNAFGEGLHGEISNLVVRELIGEAEPSATAPRVATSGERYTGRYHRITKRETPAFTAFVADVIEAEVRVELDADGFVVIDGKRFHEVDEGVFRADRPGRVSATAVFVLDQDGRRWLHTNLAGAVERSWFDGRVFRLALISLALLLLGQGLFAFRRENRALLFVAIAALAGFVLPHLAVWLIDQGQPQYLRPMRFGVPAWMVALRLLRFVAIGAGIARLVRGDDPGRTPTRIALVVAACLLLLAMELHWHPGPAGLQ